MESYNSKFLNFPPIKNTDVWEHFSLDSSYSAHTSNFLQRILKLKKSWIVSHDCLNGVAKLNQIHLFRTSYVDKFLTSHPKLQDGWRFIMIPSFHKLGGSKNKIRFYCHAVHCILSGRFDFVLHPAIGNIPSKFGWKERWSLSDKWGWRSKIRLCTMYFHDSAGTCFGIR